MPSLILKNVRTIEGKIESFIYKSTEDQIIDIEGKLTLLPALIDAHVHFRIPGQSDKEDWITGARAAIAGGVTTVFDMPNNHPPCCTRQEVVQKKALIDQQLAEADIPLRYFLFLGAHKDHLEEIGRSKESVIGIKVYMGSTTGGLLMPDDASLNRVFQLAALHNMIVAIHAEDEEILLKNQQRYPQTDDPSIHSKIRDRSAAVHACKKAIDLAEKYSTQLFILHVTTKEEVGLIRMAKSRGLLVFAEVTPHHLFLSEKDYAVWGTKVQANPPLRTEEDQNALWEGIHDGTIDTIGSDHAPHTIEEKTLPYGQAPSGIPGIETLLPLFLTAVREKKLTMGELVALTRKNAEQIYNLPHNEDIILVDLETPKTVENAHLKTKCKWSPFEGRALVGWPVYTVIGGRIFHV